MPTVGAAWRLAQKTLEDGGIFPAPREGQRIVAHLLGRELMQLQEVERQELSPQNDYLLDEILERRLKREPLAYILGYADFYGHTWAVGPQVLIPRHDTETLVEAALKALKDGNLIVEVGVGSGAVLGSILLARPAVRGVGIDISPEARTMAIDNLEAVKVLHRCKLLLGDTLAPFEGMADVIISNPPYIAEAEWAALEPDVRDFEPKLALAAGVDGLGVYRNLVPQAFAKLKPGGTLLVEIGANQSLPVGALFTQAGFTNVRTLPDLAGRDRVVMGRKP
ncbi:MAG TPA: peptide chain release factor N(5)-glutamine methyltransferase [Alphaproteobacteria bacterium]|nr:peptide chain release factor N(5)-glutamine methyltransferase [Alphaproteobacteria bacterium]